MEAMNKKYVLHYNYTYYRKNIEDKGENYMLVEKEAQIANFNVVIGEDEKPMLDYFDTFIYPAFVSDIKRKEKGSEYLFKGVEIVENSKKEYVLVGKIVKKTVLEVHSDIDETGELVEKNERHSSAPYSTFAIFLKNHRMVLVPNQKGSPTLASFRSTVHKILSEYRKKDNENRDEYDKIPDFDVKVVGIPSVKSILSVLRTVDRVNELTLRFYPLNGDFDFTGLFGSMTTDLRKAVGSKRGETVLKSPKDIDGIAKVLEDAAGTVDPIITVTTKDKSKLRLKETEFSERYKLQIKDGMDYPKENREIIKKTENISVLEYTNELHDEIYNRNLKKIIR